MIVVEPEPKEITREFRGLLENCYFCRTPTEYWHKKREPVCPHCAKTHDVGELKTANAELTGAASAASSDQRERG